MGPHAREPREPNHRSLTIFLAGLRSQHTWPLLHQAEVCAAVEAHSSASREAIVYVIQEYVARPLLWPDGCKFHFRIYAVLSATMAVHIYRKAFAHVANKPFRTDPEGGEIRPLPTTFLAGLRRPELGCVAQSTTAP